jgi:hypothetical protein
VFTENVTSATDTIISLEKWSVQNETKFKRTTTAYSDSLDLATIKSAFDNGTDGSTSALNPFSRVVNLSNNDTFVFLTSRGKHGIGRISNISPNSSTGSATLQYKIEY